MDNTKELLISILQNLSATDDSLWLEDGQVNPEVIIAELNDANVADVDTAARYVEWAIPGFRRPVAVAPVDVVAQVETVIVSAEQSSEEMGDEIDALAAEIQAAEKAIAEATKRKSSLQKMQDSMIAERDSDKSAQSDIRDYLDAQKKIAEARAEKIQFVSENRELLSDLLKTKSPIDSAMASRRRTRKV